MRKAAGTQRKKSWLQGHTHPCHPNTWKTKAGGWSSWIEGQPRTHRTSSHRSKTRKHEVPCLWKSSMGLGKEEGWRCLHQWEAWLCPRGNCPTLCLWPLFHQNTHRAVRKSCGCWKVTNEPQSQRAACVFTAEGETTASAWATPAFAEPLSPALLPA